MRIGKTSAGGYNRLAARDASFPMFSLRSSYSHRLKGGGLFRAGRSYNKGMPFLAAFSPDYVTARQRFRSLIADRGWHQESHIIRADGFAEGDLTIDWARIGSDNADRMLIISSGLHGTEAPFGSAVQTGWIESLPKSWEPPPQLAVVLLHSLNPYGFAQVRRANEDNVDLNRNFLQPEQFAELRDRTSRSYGPLDPFLNPRKPPGTFNWFPFIVAYGALRFGKKTLQETVPAGQYAFPKGIFYGGHEECQTTRILMTQMERWLGSARQVLHLDFHTGLGPFATYKLLASGKMNPALIERAETWFGKYRVEADHQTPGGYHNFGDMGEWLGHRFADREYLYLCAEFGTYGSTRVIGALRRENQAHHWGNPASTRYQQIKQHCRDTFTPESPQWREQTLLQSKDLIALAAQHCSQSEQLMRD